MTEREIRQLNRMVNSNAFLTKYQAQWPANSRPANALVRLPQIITRLNEIGAVQAGGIRDQKGGTATKAAILYEVWTDINALSRTAELVGKDTNDPNFAAQFGHPASKAADRVIAIATDFSGKIQDATVWAKFTAEGMRANLRTELSSDLQAYPTARSGQAAGRLDYTGASDELDDLVHEGIMILDGLDVFFGNFFSHDKLKLNEWKTASRLERAPHHTTTPTS